MNLLQSKFKAIIFYRDEDRVGKYLEKYKNTTPIKKFESMYRKNYIYEHFEIYCIKCDRIEGRIGARCDFIAVQKEIAEEYVFDDFVDYIYRPILRPMLANQKFNIDVKYF